MKTSIKQKIKMREGQKAEMKGRISEDAGKSICAFANTNNGMILIGVSEDKKIVGLGKDDEAKIANIASSCDPPIRIKTEVLSIEDKDILFVQVKKSDKIHSFKGKVYVRVGSTNRALSVQEILELGQKLVKIKFDEQVCENAALSDIDCNKVRWFREAYKTITGKEIIAKNEKLLGNLECIKNRKIINAGILLFGKKPEKFIPQNYITIVRYPGDEVSDRYLDMKDFYGNLFDLIDNANDYIKNNIQIASRLIPGKVAREEIPQYPLFAIRELIVNAVAHRDYFIDGSRIIIKIFKNRIEYSSPGGFPPGITSKNIVDKQYSRNPVLVKVLNKIRYIEALGEGIDRVYDSVKKHPLEPKLPAFRDVGNNVIATLYGADMEKLELERLKEELSDKEIKILEEIREKRKITSGYVQGLFNVSRDTANRYLNELIKKGVIVRKGIGKSTYYTLK